MIMYQNDVSCREKVLLKRKIAFQQMSIKIENYSMYYPFREPVCNLRNKFSIRYRESHKFNLTNCYFECILKTTNNL